MINRHITFTAMTIILLVCLSGCFQNFPDLTPSDSSEHSVVEPTEGAEEVVPVSTETTPAEAIVEPTNTAEPEAAEDVDVAANCPTAGEGTILYTSLEEGYCLLYPDFLEEEPSFDITEEGLYLLGPLHDSTAMETFRLYLIIEQNGPAEGMGSVQYAQKWVEFFATGVNLESENVSIGGQPAVVYYGLPAYGPGEQSAYIVANGFRYRIILSPQAGTVPDMDAMAQQVWETVTGSMVFFPPQSERQYVRPEDVCPQATSDYKQYTHHTDGYCLLYPAEFEEADDFPGQFVGGPVLEYGTAWGDVRSSLTLGTFGSFPDETIMEVFDPRREFVDAASILETTIAGYPAVVFRDTRGPWASRNAMIKVGDSVYTIINQPWEPERYPDGVAALNRLWDSVTGSLVFFDPWR